MTYFALRSIEIRSDVTNALSFLLKLLLKVTVISWDGKESLFHVVVGYLTLTGLSPTKSKMYKTNAI